MKHYPTRTYVAHVRPSILGPICVGIRPIGSKKVRPEEAPQEIRDYLNLPKSGRQVLQDFENSVDTKLGMSALLEAVKGDPDCTVYRRNVMNYFFTCRVRRYDCSTKPNPINKSDRSPRIRTVGDLCEALGADAPSDINHRVFKDTECGAYCSIRMNGEWIHCGDKAWNNLRRFDPIEVVLFGSIVEGSDAEVSGEELWTPTTVKQLKASLDGVNREACDLWDEANTTEEEEA